jgi:peptidoglycan/LPS O-acetylase OafA/YrhL
MLALDYQPRLDGIRAIAVLLVLENHYVSIGGNFVFGHFGVRLFFVLSGYLITRIILNYKADHGSIQRKFFTFYWHRCIRLYPPLIAVIVGTAALGLANMREDWLWHILYLSNIKIFLEQSYGPAGPLWSLSVEEQFYLIWFPLLLLLPRACELPLIIGFILIGAIFRIAIGSFIWIDMLLPANIDFLACGALLSYFEVRRPDIDELQSSWTSNLVLMTSLFVIMLCARFRLSHFWLSIDSLATAMLAFCLISSARQKINMPDLRILEWPPLLHIGKISYGLYIYHYFVAELLDKKGILLLLKSGWGGRPLMLIVEVAVTMVVTEVSWWLIERPLKRLKNLSLSGLKFSNASNWSG